jgi:hypothetical protein
MARLLGWSAFVALVIVVAGWVPIGGKTVVERLKGVRAPTALAESTWKRVGDGWDRLWGDDPAPGRDAASARISGSRAGSRAPRSARPGKAPEEHHTESDRNALDRIVAEHAR